MTRPVIKHMKGEMPTTHPRRRLLDRFGRAVAVAGGLAVFGAILIMLVFIVRETAPLLRSAQVNHVRDLAFPVDDGATEAVAPVGFGIDEYLTRGALLYADGRVNAVDLRTGTVVDVQQPVNLGDDRVSAARYQPKEGLMALGTETGRVATVALQFPVRFEGSERRVDVRAELVETIHLDEGGATLHEVAVGEGRNGRVAAGLTDDGRVLLHTTRTQRSMFGAAQERVYRFDLTGEINGKPTVLALSPSAHMLVVGTENGLVYHWDLRSPESPVLMTRAIGVGPRAGEIAAPDESGSGRVSAMEFLMGGDAVAIGDELGGVAVWFNVADESVTAGRRLQRVHVLEGHSAEVVHVGASQRNRSFITADATGVVKQHHSTSQQTFFGVTAPDPTVQSIVISPKGDAQVALTSKGLTVWAVDNPHPEINLRTLFAPILYEGYAQPQWTWQSTGGSDEFEPKFSLTPLAYGTLKGTFYSLLFALPLGILGAVYTSQFMSERLRSTIKPMIEIMAGLPSVVLGFFAGLWLAPVVAQHLPGVVVAAFVVPGMVLLAAWVWRRLPGAIKDRLPKGWEALWLLPVVVFGVVVSLQIGPVLESVAMRSDFRLWLYEVHGVSYDVRNSIVIGIAMGFAVIPIIFSISEDALSSVPRDLVAGSLALGVTRWQTVTGVVIPAALPGIVSAVMIGLGRAVGETMIVLMATGNTAVMDASPFSGFRALSANIAVEMPEAPMGGTLYRVLFVAALLLFAFTFILNTIGEIVRLRMRKRVARL